MTRPLVIKFGGELLDDPTRLATVVDAVGSVAARRLWSLFMAAARKSTPRSSPPAHKRQVDGLRITDAATLDVVVAVLAGTINTRLVAALNAAGVKPSA